MRPAAFNTGSDFHLLDHIAPLAHLLKCPLFVTEEINFNLAKRFYPQVEIIFMPDLEFKLGQIADQFDILFECKYWKPYLKSLFQDLFRKQMRLIFCPHGQSDKGFQFPLLAPYSSQDGVLIYGKLMLEMLKNLNIPLADHAIVGNYRLNFYQKHQSFYDNLISFDPRKKTVLYAPTWNDADGSSSFFEYGKRVIEELPSDWNLIIKLHPLLEQRDPARFYQTLPSKLKENVFVLHEFPPVYPILAKADIYLGDASSVGYDFLFFNRPLFFFPTTCPGRLFSCGTVLDTKQNLYLQMDRAIDKTKEQRELYEHAFSSQPSYRK